MFIGSTAGCSASQSRVGSGYVIAAIVSGGLVVVIEVRLLGFQCSVIDCRLSFSTSVLYYDIIRSISDLIVRNKIIR